MSREIMSVYIPVMSLYYDENKVREMFEKLDLGEVYSVDFVETGRLVNGKKTRSAFVYLSFWYDSYNSNKLYETICYDTSNVEEKTYHFYVSCDEYWLFLKNTSQNNDEDVCADYDEDYDENYDENVCNDICEEKEKEQITGTHTRFMDLFGELFSCMEGFVVEE